MSTAALSSSESAATTRNLAVRRLTIALNRLLASLDATPDEKLDFKPSDTARSIRELAIHVLEGNGHIGGPLGLAITPGDGPTDRESLVARLKESTGLVLSAMESVSDEMVGGTVEFFGHPMPTVAFLFASEWHFTRHTGQIDFIQTIYGDLEDHS